MRARTRAEHAISGRDDVSRSDASRSLELCERLISELFDAHPSAPSADSIYARLSQRYADCDESRAEFSALAPGPAVDRCLRRLVAIVRGEFAPALDETDRLAITCALLQRIASEPELALRAQRIRQIAAQAETQLEYHYSRLLTRELGAQPAASYGDHGSAAGRMPVRRELRIEQPSLASTKGPPDSARQLDALRRALAGFPYVDSYVQLIQAELRLLRRRPPLVFLRDREQSQLSSVERGLIRALQLETARYLDRSGCWPLQLGELSDKTIAVCGCGPLPLSGLMLQLATGARLVLIDESAPALTCARELIAQLVRVGALPEREIEYRLADAAGLRYGRGLAAHADNLVCDVVLVASLIPEPAKLRLARSVRALAPRAPLALIVRSAGGLCAALAYEPVATLQLGEPPLIFCGESLPRHQLYESLDAAAAARAGISALGSRELLAIADPQVLNSSELYYRIPGVVPTERSAATRWSVRDLEQAREMLRVASERGAAGE